MKTLTAFIILIASFQVSSQDSRTLYEEPATTTSTLESASSLDTVTKSEYESAYPESTESTLGTTTESTPISTSSSYTSPVDSNPATALRPQDVEIQPGLYKNWVDSTQLGSGSTSGTTNMDVADSTLTEAKATESFSSLQNVDATTQMSVCLTCSQSR